MTALGQFGWLVPILASGVLAVRYVVALVGLVIALRSADTVDRPTIFDAFASVLQAQARPGSLGTLLPTRQPDALALSQSSRRWNRRRRRSHRRRSH
jgi:hypothetical protein